MDYREISDDLLEILPGEDPPEAILEAMARISYELSETVTPRFAQPFDVPAGSVDFRSLVSPNGLFMDYLNGRLCSTHVEKREGRYFFDAKRFREDRGDPGVFLALVRQYMDADTGEEKP